jgi:hypothetical protein
MSQPLTFQNQFLNKYREVIGPLLTSRHNEDLFVFVIPQGPQHKGSRDPGLTQTTKRLYL